MLRPGKTPSGVEVRAHLRRLVRHIRQRWTRTRITFRGDGHYARPEAMEWCEANRVDYVFGLPGSKPLAKKIDEAAEAVRTERAVSNKPVVWVRLVLHTAAYWLMLTVRDAIPKPRDLANAEFSTLRLRLIKIAARVIETASRVRLAFAAGCPEADLFRSLPGALSALGP